MSSKNTRNEVMFILNLKQLENKPILVLFRWDKDDNTEVYAKENNGGFYYIGYAYHTDILETIEKTHVMLTNQAPAKTYVANFLRPLSSDLLHPIDQIKLEELLCEE